MRRTNIYKKLIIRAKGKIRSARIPKPLSKKNNNVFSNEKHIIMYTLMRKEKKHYRDCKIFGIAKERNRFKKNTSFHDYE